jgi:succinylarginine dihydrolase
MMTLVAPTECRESPAVKGWIDRHLASNGAIRRVNYVDVRQSMANGGGPACLRLRVQCDPADVDPRFLVDDAKLDRIEAMIARHWPEAIDPAHIQDAGVVAAVEAARAALLESLDLGDLMYG